MAQPATKAALSPQISSDLAAEKLGLGASLAALRKAAAPTPVPKLEATPKVTGPWERYARHAPASSKSGPWEKYGTAGASYPSLGDTLRDDLAPLTGFLAGTLGMPGDLETLGLYGTRALGLTSPKEGAALPTTGTLERFMGAVPRSTFAKVAQDVGSFGGGLLSPAVGIAEGTARATDLAKAALPGSIAKAEDVAETAKQAVGDLGNPFSDDAVGEQIATQIKARQAAANAARRSVAEEAWAKLGGEDDTAESIREAYRTHLARIAKDEAKNLGLAQKDLIKESSAELKGPKSMAGLDLERRRLAEIANAGEMAGYSSAKKVMAGRLASDLERLMVDRSPNFARYMQEYGELSRPVNLFSQTALGKAATRSASDFLPELPKVDPQTLPAKFFRSAQSVKELKALTGDPQFVDGMARIRAAGQLEKITGAKPIATAAKSARAWLQTNSGWLDELPDVKAAAERFADTLERASAGLDRARLWQRRARTVAIGAATLFMLSTPWVVYHAVRNALGWM